MKEDFSNRMTNLEEDSQIRMESIRTATEENINQVRTDLGKRCQEIDTAVNEVRGQGQHKQEKIEKIQRREITKIREELDIISNRPTVISHLQHLDNRELINFKIYRRNPMEFLEQIEETIEKT